MARKKQFSHQIRRVRFRVRVDMTVLHGRGTANTTIAIELNFDLDYVNLPYSKKEDFTTFVTSDSEDCGTGRVILGAVDMFL